LQWHRDAAGVGRRAEGRVAGRAEEEWEGRNFLVEGKGQAGLEWVGRAKAGRHRSRDNMGRDRAGTTGLDCS